MRNESSERDDREQALEEESQLTCEPECDMDNAVPYRSTGALGHGWECGICGNFLQAG
jgi:hypothetical protein